MFTVVMVSLINIRAKSDVIGKQLHSAGEEC